LVRRDLALGYISKETAQKHYGLSSDLIDRVLEVAKKGDIF